ncbi:MAG: DUF6064 family protein [Limibacillus sp.]
MDQIWTYRPEDFLLFSPDVYSRLFLLHNADFWWIAAVPLVFTAILGSLLGRSGKERSPATMLALALGTGWIAVGAAFFLVSYRSINWTAPYVLPLFLAAGLLLMAAALRGRFTGRVSPVRRAAGGALLLYGFVFHPLLLLLLGRPPAQLEFAFLAPDPTAIASLGLLLFGTGWLCRSAFLLALIWCGLSWLTLNTLGLAEALLPAGAALLAMASAALGRQGS